MLIVKNPLRIILPNCGDVSRLQSTALDRQLPFSKRVGMRLHLLVCSWCRRYGRQVRFLREAVHAHSEPLAGSKRESLPDSARERLKNSLRDSSK